MFDGLAAPVEDFRPRPQAGGLEGASRRSTAAKPGSSRLADTAGLCKAGSATPKRSGIKIIVGLFEIARHFYQLGSCKFLSIRAESIGFAGNLIGEGTCQLSNGSEPPRPVIWQSNGRVWPLCRRWEFFG